MSEKEINNIKKQNEGMENAFKIKGITFTKLSIDGADPDTELMLLKEYNARLKEISKNNRSKEEPKPKNNSESKPKTEKPKTEKPKTEKPKTEKPKTETEKANDEEDEDEELTKEEKITILKICNMDDCKRAFFMGEYDQFEKFVKENKLKIFKANYKWASDYNGSPDYAARNLLRGYVIKLEKYRPYLMVCFRCVCTNKEEKTYKFPSYWIVNTETNVGDLKMPIYEDFDFIPVETEEAVDVLLTKMRKSDNNDDKLVGEAYLN